MTQAVIPYVSFGVKFLDADNDGWLDLLMANGHTSDNVRLLRDATFHQPVQFFAGNGMVFHEVSAQAGANQKIMGRGLAVGDYDNDGRIDALIADSDGRPLLLHNETRSSSNWIGFRLRQFGANPAAVGARIQVTVGGKTLFRQVAPWGGYLSSSDARALFGLGTAQAVQSIAVLWPDGVRETFAPLPTGHYHLLERHRGTSSGSIPHLPREQPDA